MYHNKQALKYSSSFDRLNRSAHLGNF